MAHCSIDEIAWDAFDATKTDPKLISLAKAASLVEYGGGIYAGHLCDIFHDDPIAVRAFRRWGEEEHQHGVALRRWAEMADPTFDFEAAYKLFHEGYKTPLSDTTQRGSRAGEMVARCIVEIGTSSYYTAIKDAAREPVLKDICARIAADEFCHYKLFFDMSKIYIAKDHIGLLERWRIALSRLAECEDDELAYAFYAAHHEPGELYYHQYYKNLYLSLAFPLYRKRHIKRMVAMLLMAVNVRPNKLLSAVVTRISWAVMRVKIWLNHVPALPSHG